MATPSFGLIQADRRLSCIHRREGLEGGRSSLGWLQGEPSSQAVSVPLCYPPGSESFENCGLCIFSRGCHLKISSALNII